MPISQAAYTSPNVDHINAYIQEELRRRRLGEVPAVEAARWLDDAQILKDSDSRPGLPLRKLLRRGQIHGAIQRPVQQYGRWYIGRVEAPETKLGERLLEVAEAQIAAGHYDLAVVISQVAVETVAGAAFMTLFSLNVPRSLETMMKVLPDRSFQQDGTRRLWQDLTGDRISKSAYWKEYDGTHIKRRNRAAHGSTLGFQGDPISKEDAEQSLAATRGMLDHIHGVLAKQLDLLLGGPDPEHAPELDQWRALAVLSPRPGKGLREVRT